MNFENKYSKYKKKYLNLQKSLLKGSKKNKPFILIIHNIIKNESDDNIYEINGSIITGGVTNNHILFVHLNKDNKNLSIKFKVLDVLKGKKKLQNANSWNGHVKLLLEFIDKDNENSLIDIQKYSYIITKSENAYDIDPCECCEWLKCNKYGKIDDSLTCISENSISNNFKSLIIRIHKIKKLTEYYVSDINNKSSNYGWMAKARGNEDKNGNWYFYETDLKKITVSVSGKIIKGEISDYDNLFIHFKNIGFNNKDYLFDHSNNHVKIKDFYKDNKDTVKIIKVNLKKNLIDKNIESKSVTLNFHFNDKNVRDIFKKVKSSELHPYLITSSDKNLEPCICCDWNNYNNHPRGKNITYENNF